MISNKMLSTKKLCSFSRSTNFVLVTSPFEVVSKKSNFNMCNSIVWRPFVGAVLDPIDFTNRFVEIGPFIEIVWNTNLPYKCIFRGGSFWEPFSETDLDWTVRTKKGGVATNDFCSSECYYICDPQLYLSL
jgi:hypothetical protein